MDATMEEEYAFRSNLLQEFTRIPDIDKAWMFKSDSSLSSQGMFCISQPNIVENKRRKFIVSCIIFKESESSVNFQWAAFPIEMSGVSIIVPSPSGSKLLAVRNPENEGPSHFEIWSSSQIGVSHLSIRACSVYTDGWYVML